MAQSVEASRLSPVPQAMDSLREQLVLQLSYSSYDTLCDELGRVGSRLIEDGVDSRAELVEHVMSVDDERVQ